MTRTWPTGSSRRFTAARDSGTYRAVSAMAAMPTGMLIQKTLRQPAESTSAPPMTGPERDRQAEDGAPEADCLRPLGRLGERVGDDRHRDRVSMDPPIACRARNATSQPRLGAREQAREPMAKTTRPALNTVRRPIRSPTEPDSISRLATTSM